jgi:hypothetical protein
MGEREVVPFEKTSGGGERIFCRYVLPVQRLCMQAMKHAISVIRKLERRDSVLNVDVEDVVILLPLVKLLASRTDSIDDLAYFLPLITRAIPLIGGLIKSMLKQKMKHTWCASVIVPFCIILTSPGLRPRSE